MATSKQPIPKTAIIIGSGAGGIATAARLAKAGYKVTVVEKNDFLGGRCSLLHSSPPQSSPPKEGDDPNPRKQYRFDQGPSLLLLPNLFRETFHDLDTSLEAEGVELLRCPVNYQIFFHDGVIFRPTTDLASMKRQIEHYEGKDGFERYLAWMAESHRHYELSVEHVLHKNHDSIATVLTPFFARMALKLHPFESIWSRAGRYFKTERLRRVFTFATMYMGMSPFDAPSTYSLLQYTEAAEGIWYPRGGFQTILARLADVGVRLGVTYRLSAPVRRILPTPDGKAAAGVELEGGEVLKADVVVVNADLVYAYSNLFPESARDQGIAQTATAKGLAGYAKFLRKRDASCSSVSFYWSLSRKIPELDVHNIFLAEEYKESFDSIFKRQTLPDDPSFYVNVPSRIDPSAAPEGCDAVIVLVPVGHLLRSKGNEGEVSAEEQDWPAVVSRAREAVLRTINARTGCEPLENYIINEMYNDPYTWEEKFNLDKGAILGLSHNFSNVLCFRPSVRAKGLERTYFVGASAYPGTGVPIVLAGAKITAEEILKDAGIQAPWADTKPVMQDKGVPQDARTGPLDRVDRSHSVYRLWALVLFAMLKALILYALTESAEFITAHDPKQHTVS
ncbi:phytoene dehydrogenase AL-1 [Cytospora paraplurivora]|uniref:Phytoene dehydrogenase AL-1 n=1 Tax=Cytospora paraplurivora TaxID=2898453 RepID=A0AAN9U9N1_9PEZI